MSNSNQLKSIPSVDRLLASDEMRYALERFGHSRTTSAIRTLLTELRTELKQNSEVSIPGVTEIAETVVRHLSESDLPSLRKVFNMTGTVLHTNLGRAALPEAALLAVTEVAGGNSNLEFDLDSGKRGDRDEHIETLLKELTGAEAATVGGR